MLHPRRRPLPALLDLAHKSLLRGSAVVLVSLAAAILLSDFPHNRPNPWIALPALLATLGTADTVRCMQKRWSFYHAGVVLSIYMDLMALAVIVFFLLYPYTHLFTGP